MVTPPFQNVEQFRVQTNRYFDVTERQTIAVWGQLVDTICLCTCEQLDMISVAPPYTPSSS